MSDVMTARSLDNTTEWVTEKNADIESVINNFEKKYGKLRAGIDESIFKDAQIRTIGTEKYLEKSDGCLHKIKDITAEGAKKQNLKTIEEYEKEAGIIHPQENKDYFGADFNNLQSLITEYSNSFDGFGGMHENTENLAKKLQKINVDNLDDSGKKQYTLMQENIKDLVTIAMQRKNQNT